MTVALKPTSVEELAAAIRAHPRVLVIGAQTKPRLSQVKDDDVLISTTALRGIIEYEPSEFTLTALAGTPVREIATALAAQGQYLPFDPVWLEAGSTIGGAVAAGINGAGRLRYGGLRDFILGVRFIDGSGQPLRVGGKVVKNAAGFDLPKFFVGSLGRFGALAEITFKVFPRPANTLTLRLPAKDPAAATAMLTAAAATRWECDALEYSPAPSAVYLRLCGPEPALDSLAQEILARWPGQKLSPTEAEGYWTGLREFRWSPAEDALLKVAITPALVEIFCRLIPEIPEGRLQIGAAGNVAYLSLPASAGTKKLDEALQDWGVAALALRGDVPLWLGAKGEGPITAAVKKALDPENRFLSLSE
jgi:glycolate oxidase FAD binding subunit